MIDGPDKFSDQLDWIQFVYPPKIWELCFFTSLSIRFVKGVQHTLSYENSYLADDSP